MPQGLGLITMEEVVTRVVAVNIMVVAVNTIVVVITKQVTLAREAGVVRLATRMEASMEVIFRVIRGRGAGAPMVVVVVSSQTGVVLLSGISNSSRVSTQRQSSSCWKPMWQG